MLLFQQEGSHLLSCFNIEPVCGLNWHNETNIRAYLKCMSSDHLWSVFTSWLTFEFNHAKLWLCCWTDKIHVCNSTSKSYPEWCDTGKQTVPLCLGGLSFTHTVMFTRQSFNTVRRAFAFIRLYYIWLWSRVPGQIGSWHLFNAFECIHTFIAAWTSKIAFSEMCEKRIWGCKICFWMSCLCLFF